MLRPSRYPLVTCRSRECSLVLRGVNGLTLGGAGQCCVPALPAPALALGDGDRRRLTGWVRSSTVRAGLAQRARIVLLAAEGVSNTEIAERVATPAPRSWRPPRAGRPAARRPVRDTELLRRRPQRLGDDPIVIDAAGPTRPRLVQQAHDPTPVIARTPRDHRRPRHPPRRWRGRGARTGWRRGGRRRSSSPPTPSWWPRSPTWSGSTWPRRRTRSSCAWTSRVGMGRATIRS
jgi:hypothetical protein